MYLAISGLLVCYMVEAAGVEPTMPGAGDLQSPGVTNFPTPPCLNYNTLPLCCQPLVKLRRWRVCIKVFFNIFLQIKEHFNTLPFSSHKSECHPVGRPFAHVLSAG